MFSIALSYIKFVTFISTYLFYVFAQLFLSSMKVALQLMEARAKRVAMRTREDWLRGKSKNIVDFSPISLFKFLTTTVSKFFFKQYFIFIYDPTHFFTLLYLIPLVLPIVSLLYPLCHLARYSSPFVSFIFFLLFLIMLPDHHIETVQQQPILISRIRVTKKKEVIPWQISSRNIRKDSKNK